MARSCLRIDLALCFRSYPRGLLANVHSMHVNKERCGLICSPKSQHYLLVNRDSSETCSFNFTITKEHTGTELALLLPRLFYIFFLKKKKSSTTFSSAKEEEEEEGVPE